jgi:hypothetical protein
MGETAVPCQQELRVTYPYLGYIVSLSPDITDLPLSDDSVIISLA